jgi:hypothetical protein
MTDFIHRTATTFLRIQPTKNTYIQTEDFRKMAFIDYYKTLGISKDASIDERKNA